MSAPRIHPTALIEPGVEIGDDTAIWDGVHVRSGAVIGRQCIVGEKTYIACGVRIGDRVKINAHVYLCAGMEVGDGCLLAAHVVFTNDRLPRATDPDLQVLLPSELTAATAGSRLGRGVTVGANATVGPGLELGDYCMVGMGAVVTSNVPCHGLFVGNPGRLVGLVARDGTPVLRLRGGESLPHHAVIPCPGDGALVIEDGVVRHRA